MANTPDDITKLNEDANTKFNGKDEKPAKGAEDAKDVKDANEAADAEFNAEGEDIELGNTVGGLRGSSD